MPMIDQARLGNAGAETTARRAGPGRFVSGVAVATALAALLLGAGCTAVSDFFAGEDVEQTADGQDKDKAKVAKDAGKPAPGADGKIPNLSTVPAKRPQVSSRKEREKLAEGLVADRDGQRRYASDAIPLQGEAASALAPPPAPPPAPSRAAAPPSPQSAAPAPRAAPSQPVAAMPAPPPAQQMAIAPAPIAMPADRAMPAAGDNVLNETYQRALAQRRPGKGAAAQPQSSPASPAMPAKRQMASLSDNTLVIDADGIVTGGVEVAGGGAAPVKRPAPGGRSVKAASIIFANGSAQLSPRDQAILREVAQLYRERGGRLRVVGHASSRTRNMEAAKRKMVNYGISAARAQAVAEALVGHGAERGSIQISALSDNQPLYLEVMPSGETGNRRTEIFIDN